MKTLKSAAPLYCYV